MKFFKEFKEFLARGNVMDLAVAVVIGAAFTAIVNSLVKDIIMPFIGVLTGGLDFSTWAITVGEARFTYGNFISAIINFVLISLVIFMMVKLVNKMRKAEPKPRLCPYCKQAVAADATRCPFCTSIIDPNKDDAPQPNQEAQEAETRSGRRQIG